MAHLLAPLSAFFLLDLRLLVCFVVLPRPFCISLEHCATSFLHRYFTLHLFWSPLLPCACSIHSLICKQQLLPTASTFNEPYLVCLCSFSLLLYFCVVSPRTRPGLMPKTSKLVFPFWCFILPCTFPCFFMVLIPCPCPFPLNAPNQPLPLSSSPFSVCPFYLLLHPCALTRH